MLCLPYARRARKRLLVLWIKFVACHQRTKCSSGHAATPRFLVVSCASAGNAYRQLAHGSPSAGAVECAEH
jgi:hypothetical protein